MSANCGNRRDLPRFCQDLPRFVLAAFYSPFAGVLGGLCLAKIFCHKLSIMSYSVSVLYSSRET
jgi:hypothetical protein